MKIFDIIYNEICLRIICEPQFENMIKNHLYGHAIFEEPQGNATYTLYISENKIIKPGLYQKIVDKWFNYATADCYIDNANNICYLNNISADGPKNKTLLIQYFTSNVFNRLLEINGFIGLHSSCVEKNGNGILFVAGRNSGKTVCMLNMMSAGYNFVTNDKSAINYNAGMLVNYGIAQSVSIRMSKEFRSKKENKKYVNIALKQNKRLYDENKLEGNNILMNDSDVAKLNNVSISTDCTLKLLVFPKYNAKIEHPLFRKMTELETLMLIKTQLLPLVHETTEFLENIYIKEINKINLEEVIEKLSKLPSFYCEQNENTTIEFIEMLDKLILERKDKVKKLKRTFEK